MHGPAAWPAGLLLLLALLPCLCESPRGRRDVHKRAHPPRGGDGGRPITGLEMYATTDGPNRREQRLPFVDVRRLLHMLFPPSNGSHNHELQPHLSRHIDASMAELVAMQTLEGDVAWIEARFVNESHRPVHSHRRKRPYSLEERLMLLTPVVCFLLPFVVWVCCMVTCIARATVHKSY